MRRPWLAIGLALPIAVSPMAGTAMAQSLQGQWQYCLTDVTGTYSGLVAIDGEGRAHLSAVGPRNVITQEGYVRVAEGKVEVVFTSYQAPRPYALDHFHCTIHASDVLDCVNRDVAGQVSEPFVFSRAAGAATPPGSNTAYCARPSVGRSLLQAFSP